MVYAHYMADQSETIVINLNYVESHLFQLTHLEEMVIKVNPELPPIAIKPYPLP